MQQKLHFYFHLVTRRTMIYCDFLATSNEDFTEFRIVLLIPIRTSSDSSCFTRNCKTFLIFTICKLFIYPESISRLT